MSNKIRPTQPGSNWGPSKFQPVARVTAPSWKLRASLLPLIFPNTLRFFFFPPSIQVQWRISSVHNICIDRYHTMPSPSPDNGAGSASNFPTDPAEFDRDPRISFSKLDDKFILETDDGKSLCTIQQSSDGFKRYVTPFIDYLRYSDNHQALVCDNGRNKHFYVPGN